MTYARKSKDKEGKTSEECNKKELKMMALVIIIMIIIIIIMTVIEKENH